jgi:metal-responsive CopG/Arc/MetJ family transcriptional regulator
MTNKKLKPVIVVIDKPLLKRIDKAAAALGMNRSQLIRAAMERELEVRANG